MYATHTHTHTHTCTHTHAHVRTHMHLFRDKVNPDDFIGTCYLHMSEISVPGENGKSL